MKAIIKTDDLKRLVKSTRHFISKDENRPVLNFIRLEFEKAVMTVKATGLDGYKLSEENAHIKEIDESFIAYIKPYIPVGIKSDVITIEMVGNKCFIDAGESSIAYKQPRGDKIDTKKIIGDLESNPAICEFFIDRDFLVDALKSICEKENIRESVAFEFRGEDHPILLKSGESKRVVMVKRRRKKEGIAYE